MNDEIHRNDEFENQWSSGYRVGRRELVIERPHTASEKASLPNINPQAGIRPVTVSQQLERRLGQHLFGVTTVPHIDKPFQELSRDCKQTVAHIIPQIKRTRLEYKRVEGSNAEFKPRFRRWWGVPALKATTNLGLPIHRIAPLSRGSEATTRQTLRRFRMGHHGWRHGGIGTHAGIPIGFAASRNPL